MLQQCALQVFNIKISIINKKNHFETNPKYLKFRKKYFFFGTLNSNTHMCKYICIRTDILLFIYVNKIYVYVCWYDLFFTLLVGPMWTFNLFVLDLNYRPIIYLNIFRKTKLFLFVYNIWTLCFFKQNS